MSFLGEGVLTGHYTPSDSDLVAQTRVVAGLEFGAPGGGATAG